MNDQWRDSGWYDEAIDTAVASGDFARAKRLTIEAAERHPDSAIAQLRLGDVHMRNEDYGWARQAFARAVALDPFEAIAHFRLAEALAWLGESRAAQLSIRSGMETRTTPACAEELYTEGIARSLLRDFKGAQSCFEYAIRLEDDNTDFLRALSWCAEQRGLRAAAIDAAVRVLEIEPSDTHTRLALGNLYFESRMYVRAAETWGMVPPEEFPSTSLIMRYAQACRTARVELQGGGSAWSLRMDVLESDPVEKLIREVSTAGARL